MSLRPGEGRNDTITWGGGSATPSHHQGEEEEEFTLLILFDAAELWVREALMTPGEGCLTGKDSGVTGED